MLSPADSVMAAGGLSWRFRACRPSVALTLSVADLALPPACQAYPVYFAALAPILSAA